MTKPLPPERFQIMNPDPAWHLLDRYFGGECSSDEVEFVTRWVGGDPSNGHLLEGLRTIWVDAALARPAIDDDAAWHALRTRMAGAGQQKQDGGFQPLDITPSTAPAATSPRRRRARWNLLPIAAALAATLGIGIWWRARESATPFFTAFAREFVTTRGQRTELTLADGSRIVLGVDSRLRLRAGYGVTNRDVQLEGEAYFVVTHDSSRRFRVFTRQSVSEDLGTEFDVRAYPDDRDLATVAVAAGQVALQAIVDGPAGGVVELTGGQVARLDRAMRIHVARDADVASVLAWREGRLEFDGRPAAEVARELERWYDLDITVDDSLAQVPVHASLGGDQSADQALAIVATALDAHSHREGRHVRLLARVPQ